MVSGPVLVPLLLSACLLAALLHLPEAEASYAPQSAECRGKGKECTGRSRCRTCSILPVRKRA